MLQSLIAVCIGCRDNTIDVFNPVTYMLVKFSLALVCWVALMPAVIAAQPKSGGNETGLAATPAEPSPTAEPPLASSVDLKQVFESPFPLEAAELPHALQAEAALLKEAKSVANGGAEWGPIQFMLNANDILKEANTSRQLLGVKCPPPLPHGWPGNHREPSAEWRSTRRFWWSMAPTTGLPCVLPPPCMGMS